MERKESLLFVYGSLKRGQASHAMLGSAVYLESAWTADGYRLLDLGAYPALALGGEGSIEGELFRLEEAAFQALDSFEGLEYVRGEVVLADGRSAFAYFATEVVSRQATAYGGPRWPARK